MKMKKLADLYSRHHGKVSDKWYSYLDVYDRLLLPYQELPVELLEIGVQNGGSLEIWSQYFSAAQSIVGCDINPDCAKLTYDDERIHLVVGDANLNAVERSILNFASGFDIVIDDGSHSSGDIVRSFCRYFPHVRDGGMFIAEDLHCSYWNDYEGGLFRPFSSVSFFKRLADIVNHEHWGVEKTKNDLLSGFLIEYGVELNELDLMGLHSVEFINSICVVRKQAANRNQLGPRVIAGQDERVLPGHFEVSGAVSIPPPQATNPWTAMSMPPEQAFLVQKQELADLQKTIADKDKHIAALYNSLSWRLTSPMRSLVGLVPKLKTHAALVKTVVQRNGGLTRSFKTALALWRSEGARALFYAVANAGLTGRSPRPAQGSAGFDRNDYTEWVRRYDTLTDEDRATMRQIQSSFSLQPVVSVLMPTYNPKPEWLIEAIESVRSQIYTNWQLCIADDASTDPAVRIILEKYAVLDDRIRVVFRPKNGHISAASNSALELVSGEWVALLDHDDLLSEHALFWVVEAVNRVPHVGLIYSDEDKIAEDGQRSGPYFKCEWNRDLFYSHNMISHLGVYQVKLVKSIGGFRAGLEGSQDYDLALRSIERLENEQIVHIPKVLYHWRVHAESTSMSGAAKPYAYLAGERAINEHFSRTGVRGRVDFFGNGYHPTYQLPDILPLVSIIVPTRNGGRLLKKCMESVFKRTSYREFEIVIMDNGSDDPDTLDYLAMLAKRPRVRVVRTDEAFNFSRLNNAGVRQCHGELVTLLNDDVEVISANWLSVMVAHALRPGVGAVGAKLWYPNKTLQHGGVILGIGGGAGHAHKHLRSNYNGMGRMHLTQNFSAVTAACLVIRKSTYLKLNGLNEIDLTVAYGDIDFCLRLQDAGYRNVWTPLAELFHHESATRGAEDTPSKQARLGLEGAYMRQMWAEQWQNDPAYSPNLTLDHEDFSLAWPPRVTDLKKYSKETAGR